MKRLLLITVLFAAACRAKPSPDRVRISGQVEATDIHIAAKVGGRLVQLRVAEGDHVSDGAVIANLESTDAELALARARADRDQAAAQLRLALVGSRPEDVRMAEAQVAGAQSTIAGAEADLAGAEADLVGADADAVRFEALLAQNSGSRKQRDDAVARRDVAKARRDAAKARGQGAQDQTRAAREQLARVRAGSRQEEIEAARARVAAAEAQMAVYRQAIADATVVAPVTGVVTEKIADVGELLQPHAPIVVVTDLDHAWANVYLDEPLVARVRVGQPATLFTDAGGAGIAGTVSTIAEKAEFTPRNAQTADERAKLVYRLKIAVDNRSGVLKSGMPVEAEIPLAR
jgi:HlyD family secretion protein